MHEWLDSAPEAEVVESEYVRLLGYPIGRKLEGRAKELADETRQWYRAHGRPWIYARELAELAMEDGEVILEGERFHSPYLLRQLEQAEAHGGFLVAVSAGPECEARSQALWQAGKPDEYFFMEMYGGAVVEHLIMQAGARLCAWADTRQMVALPHYSPGYPEWDVAQQVPLLELISSGAKRAFPSKLECLESGMLRPKKALLGLIGITRSLEKAASMTTLVPCQRCSLPNCAYRRRPYIFDPQQAFDGMDNNGSTNPSSVEKAQSAESPPLKADLRYETNRRALRKWSEERLELVRSDDGSVKATFRYEGSTCSNMGHPLSFVYAVSMGGPESGYRIKSARCEPAAGDSGFAQMCEYLKRGDDFMDDIREEAPLLGEPLEAIQGWNPVTSYAGCYCDANARSHKWRMVYEVIHYALVQRQSGTEASALARVK